MFSKQRLRLLFAGLAVLVAVLTLMSAYASFTDYQSKKDWPLIKATVVHTAIVGKRAVLPEITYQYQVNGRVFTGKSDLQTPPFGHRNKRTLTAQAIVKEHPVGSTLLVAYNPQNPAQSTTGFRLPWNFYMKLSFAISLFLVAAYLLSRFFKKQNKIL